MIETTDPRLLDAIWAGDVDALDALAPCRCCCAEHTFEGCEARAWGGCRGQGTPPAEERRAWVDHYRRFHGWTEARFHGVPEDEWIRLYGEPSR